MFGLVEMFAVANDKDSLESTGAPACRPTIRKLLRSSGCCCGANPSILREPVESFITPQLRFYPIERALLCQTSTNCFRRFVTMSGQMLQLVFDFFFGDINIFRRGDAVDNQLSLYIVLGTVFIPFTQRHPIDIYRARINALLRQRSHYSF